MKKQFPRLSIAVIAFGLMTLRQTNVHAAVTYTPGDNRVGAFAVDYTLSQGGSPGQTSPPGTAAAVSGAFGASAYSASANSIYNYDAATGTLHYRFNSSTTSSVTGNGVSQATGASSFSFTVDQPYYCTVSLNQIQSASPDFKLYSAQPLLYNYVMFGPINGQADFLQSPSLQFVGSFPSTYIRSRSNTLDNIFSGLPAHNYSFYFSNFSQLVLGQGSSTSTADIILSPLAPGTSQVSPILPDGGSNQTYSYTTAHSGQWFDPPVSPRFDYQMNGT